MQKQENRKAKISNSKPVLAGQCYDGYDLFSGATDNGESSGIIQRAKKTREFDWFE